MKKLTGCIIRRLMEVAELRKKMGVYVIIGVVIDGTAAVIFEGCFVGGFCCF